MKQIRLFTWFGLALLVLANFGCSGGSSSSSSQPATTPGPLDPGGSGVTLQPIQEPEDGGAPTAVFSLAAGINDAGQVVGFAETAAGSIFKAALWAVDTAGAATAAPVQLKPLGENTFSAAFALDAGGQAVGVSQDGAAFVAVLWSQAAAEPIKLPSLAAGGNSVAFDISPDGTLIVGEAADASLTTRAVLWRVDDQGDVGDPQLLPVSFFTKVTGQGTLFSTFSSASGVNNAGQIAGEVEDGEGALHAVIWEPTGAGGYLAVDLRGGGEVGSSAIAINTDGVVTGEWEKSPGLFIPAIWAKTAEGEYKRTSLAEAGSAAAVNDSGRIAGWSGIPDQATVWKTAGLTSETLFTTKSQAYGINDAAQPLVVGRQGSTGFIKRIN